jgi:hypothetical protein
MAAFVGPSQQSTLSWLKLDADFRDKVWENIAGEMESNTTEDDPIRVYDFQVAAGERWRVGRRDNPLSFFKDAG